jgi:EAL domain-containing protein (putative c-di-GMP-specific phosphodiesterase class I)/ActR/RegA family two-component response regulator
MYRAKQTGGNNFQFYTSAMNERALERLRLERDLRNALERDEFLLHYQPQVDLRTGRIVGMEALIRWNHPELGMIPPLRFIGLAEETGLIVPIGAWVIRTACAKAMAWQRAGLGHLRIAVNLSARQFGQRDIVQSIATVLEETGLSAGCLEIELTESMVMTEVERAIGILRELKTLGVQISIDDFGTGYSSLSYLKRFPIDVLKIDQSFVRDITVDPDDASITLSIFSLAHSLKLYVIAEGVETEAQLSFLRHHHCDEIQGYYFSRPVPAAAFEQLLKQGKSLPAQSGGGMRRQTILIVDDDVGMAAAVQKLLDGEGYEMLVAKTAANGLDMLASNEVQVIVCDQQIPLVDSDEFLDKVSKLYPGTLRIVLSADADLHAVTDAINRGAIYRFFTKPWESGLLHESIRAAFHHYWLMHDTSRLPIQKVARKPRGRRSDLESV